MLPRGISHVSICIYNSYQSEIGFQTVLGGRRHAHKEAVCQKKGSGAEDEGWQHFFSRAMFLESVVCEHCVVNISMCDVHACFYVYLCTCSRHVSDNKAILPNPILPLPSFPLFHHSRKRFFTTL